MECGTGRRGYRQAVRALPPRLRREALSLEEGEQPVEFINPQLLEQSGSQEVIEGCLSYPGQWGMITRPDRVKLRAQDRQGEWFEMEGEGLMAQAMLHEYGHLDGHAFKDDPTFTPLTEEEVEAMTSGEG